VRFHRATLAHVPGWKTHGERSLYESDWVNLRLVDVELPSGARFEHHVVRATAEAAAVVIRRDDTILLVWRHRFVTDTWGWEVPAGRVDPGETPAQAAAREAEEETGWRPGPLRALGTYHPINGMGDNVFHCFAADGAEQVGTFDPDEASELVWTPVPRVRELVAAGEVKDGFSLTALLLALM
jgi:8-oxo-dGTP pyrophosphatase MutT (NUDIX family)